jgi:molybdate transport system substrate-binding protein
MLAALAVPLSAAGLSTLATQAVEAALTTFARDYRQQTGTDVQISFDTGPNLARRVAAGEAADILIAPAAVVDQAITDGRAVGASRVEIGRVAVGVATRRGVPRPDISSVEALKTALLEADAVVYSQGTSGLYIQQMLADLGLTEQLTGKARQLASGAVAMARIGAGTGNEIGFTMISEIKAAEAKGVVLVGPLPAAVQHYTTYAAAVMTRSSSAGAARAFLGYIRSPAARNVLAATGWERMISVVGQ